MDPENERVEAVIDLGAVKKNFENMKKNLRVGVRMIAVVKTDAYGHGAVKVAHLVEDYDYIWGFAVATAEEALELRRANVRKPILILGYAFPEDYDMLVREDIRPAVFKLSMAKALSDAAVRAGKTIRVFFAVDTGMSRIGFSVNSRAADEAAEIACLPFLEIEGIFTHFARADETDKEPARRQAEKFDTFVKMLEERSVDIPLKSVSNSAGILEMPEYHYDLVRAGITIYGIYPSDEVSRETVKLYPAMSLVSHISYIKEVESGTAVSYGGTFVTERPTRIATVPVGYGDGYPRSLSGKGSVLIRGKRAPILGRICMDQFMVDVTDIEAEEGDRVTLLGKDGDEQISVEELSGLSGRFPYEFTCCISKRVPRRYLP